MKKIKFFFPAIAIFFCMSFVSAQNADEVISNYINAIGGKDVISQITSIYMEGNMEAMGSQGTMKTTLLNGKGFKQEIDVMGTQVVMCYTDSMGWQINPMTGNYNAEVMTEAQYRPGREQIYAGGLLMTDYAAKGYKLDYAGVETVGMASAHKLNMTSPDSTETAYYFDPQTWYLIKMVQKAEMMGQTMDISVNLSNYQKPENGFAMPYSIETNYGGQFFLTANFNKVEINNPVDPVVFAKP